MIIFVLQIKRKSQRETDKQSFICGNVLHVLLDVAVDPSHSMWAVALQGLHSIAWQLAGIHGSSWLGPSRRPRCPIRNQRQATATELQPLHRKHSPRSPSTHRNCLPRLGTACAANLCFILQPSTDNPVNRPYHPAALRRLSQSCPTPPEPISRLPPATTAPPNNNNNNNLRSSYTPPK
jgi:hypothetical protein